MNKKKEIILFAAIVAASCGLRATITGVGSLVNIIKESLNLSSSMAGMLTTIPLLAFGIISVLVGGFAKKAGAGRTMLVGLLFLAGGITVRSFLGSFGLFLGTIIIGIGIAVGNVLIPAMIKAFFPDKVGVMTSVYTTAMSVFAGISGGISVPLAKMYGWQNALFFWIAITVISIVLWFPNRKIVFPQKETDNAKSISITKDSMTWWITLYMGVQSLLFYCFVAWFATILQSRGFEATVAGYFNSAYMLLGVPGSLIVPIIAGKSKNQSKLGISLGIIYIVGMFFLLVSDNIASLVIAVLCCGFCSGACISFSMVLFGLHTKNANDTSALSGLAQSVGYLLAAVGPTCMGKIYDMAGNWTLPLIVLFVLAVILIALGAVVGKERIINEN